MRGFSGEAKQPSTPATHNGRQTTSHSKPAVHQHTTPHTHTHERMHNVRIISTGARAYRAATDSTEYSAHLRWILCVVLRACALSVSVLWMQSWIPGPRHTEPPQPHKTSTTVVLWRRRRRHWQQRWRLFRVGSNDDDDDVGDAYRVRWRVRGSALYTHVLTGLAALGSQLFVYVMYEYTCIYLCIVFFCIQFIRIYLCMHQFLCWYAAFWLCVSVCEHFGDALCLVHWFQIKYQGRSL